MSWERPWQYELAGQGWHRLAVMERSAAKPALQVQAPRWLAPEESTLLLAGQAVHAEDLAMSE